MRFEHASPERHEYVAGAAYAMTGAPRRHNRIVGNMMHRLWNATRGGPCEVYFETVAGVGDVPVPCPALTLTLDEIHDGVQTAVDEPERGEPESGAYEPGAYEAGAYEADDDG